MTHLEEVSRVLACQSEDSSYNCRWIYGLKGRTFYQFGIQWEGAFTH